MRPSLFSTMLGSLLLLAPLHAQQSDPKVHAIQELGNAVARVKEIVNQPVTCLPMGPEDRAALFKPGWFHPGAITPDFDNVDVRTSQKCSNYEQWPYVTSDITPGTMFIGSELEFNAMTKFFYTDRNHPKKKLTEREMLEINGLYRVIGKCVKQIKELQAQPQQAGDPPLDANALRAIATLVLPAVAATVGESASLPQGKAEPQLLTSPRTLGALGLALMLILVWIQVRRNRS